MSLSFTPILESGLVLIPGNSHVLKLVFENESEYDKQLFCTLRSPDGLCLSRNHFDVLVPAEGKSIETIKITVPDDLRIFYESYFFVLETTDAVLEEDKHFAFFLRCALPWKWQSENNACGKIFMGSAHACSSAVSAAKLTLTAHLACAEISSAILNVNSDKECEIFISGESKGVFTNENTIVLNLSKGINTVSISTSKQDNAITADITQSSDYVPACINPDFI